MTTFDELKKDDSKPKRVRKTSKKTDKPVKTAKIQAKNDLAKNGSNFAKDDKPKPEPKPNKGNYYRLDRILKEDADYNLIIGERSNGKTYAIQEYLISQWLDNGGQFFLLKRWQDDVKPMIIQNALDGNLLNRINQMSNGRFDNIIFRNGRFIAVTYDDKGKPIIDDSNTVGYVWDLTESERLKSLSFPNVTNVYFEEFISLHNEGYHPDEIRLFLNIISTIVRDRTNVKIWMLGNTTNPYNPYFKHFGINGYDLNQGDIWTRYDSMTGCKVALEFCAQRNKGDRFGTSDKYYAFGEDGVKDMITTGKWQIPNYPTQKFIQKLSNYRMAVRFDDKLMILHLMIDKNKQYLFVQNVKNTTTLSSHMAVLDLQPNPKPNYYTSFNNLPMDNKVNQLIIDLLNNSKICYDKPMTGAYFNNFVSQSIRLRTIQT